MAVHVFVTDEINYQICISRGLVGLPEAEGRNFENITDGLISRMAGIKENDYVLMYMIE